MEPQDHTQEDVTYNQGLSSLHEKMGSDEDAAQESGKPYSKLRGQMVQTTITLTPADLDTITEAARRSRMTRAAFIRTAVFKYIDTLQ